MKRRPTREERAEGIARLARQCHRPELAPWVCWRPGDPVTLTLGDERRYLACSPYAYPDTDDVHPWWGPWHPLRACGRDWRRRSRTDHDVCQS